ncbi:dynamin family protein [Oceanobacillus halotolerans]|uniref:dynamin family protein n=1 Tax=Oceanobacillus halotolerans TaxID=2663380 RepID=UPI001CF7CF71|nr:dynamin family protein [Oceanobacillus halotolerans]
MIQDKTRLLSTAQHLVALHNIMYQHQDYKNASKVIDLYEKHEKEELIISFAGHFSAGKSSMINMLLGEEILPKSPIPTSANIVKITSGKGEARIFFRHEQPIVYKEPYDMDTIKEYCKDKDTIQRIELETSKKIVPDSSAIMDTPGIDASDDADRLITEGSLHLVDILFYVMDYNHVQSEENLQFLSALHEKNIPFYVIINQIDKHDESELAFLAFEKSIQQTFQEWDIYPELIFYSSLIDPSAEHNQFDTIKKTLHNMMTKEKDKYVGMNNAVHQLVEDHKQFLTMEYEEKIDDLQEVEGQEEVDFSEIESLAKTLQALREKPKKLEAEYQSIVNHTLKNAYVMPAELRDKATSFLESQQPDFKIGIFASKKKTEKAKADYLANFLQPLQERIETAIQWKLRDKLIDFLKTNDMNNTFIIQQVQSLQISYSEEDLIRLIKPGAKVNGDSVLNYTNEVRQDILNKYKQQVRSIWDVIQQYYNEQIKEEIITYEEKLSSLEKKQSIQNQKESLQSELEQKQRQIDEQFQTIPDEKAWELLKDQQNSRNSKVEQKWMEVDHSPRLNEKKDSTQKIESKSADKQFQQDDILKHINKINKTINGVPGLQEIQASLQQKQHRLTNRSYTIALFGAFSAGKSSFANALIGDQALPVSPNPTTATVNRIKPVTEKYSHGTVVITFKSHSEILHDLELILKHFTPPTGDVAAILNWVENEQITESKQLNKMYQSYLQGMISGFSRTKDSIGNSIPVTVEELRDYVTDETIACFVKTVDLYYECAITNQGITLVDTPGADSVNARHTNVAFDYIKEADAILYVTYYNHALTRADRDFLMQLGRVKETFELDKMFFIVNAVDLAENDTEVTLVTDYIEEKLVELGIRFPRLFPVSSKQSLQEKQERKLLNEKMMHFEEKFYHFLHHELAALIHDSILRDFERSYFMLENYIASLELDHEEKERYKQQLMENHDQSIQVINRFNPQLFEENIEQKLTKQLFYVLERLSIRFHDFFKETFNPTTITESGSRAKSQLTTNLQELIDYVGFELKQEVQAVSLRIESFMKTQVNDIYEDLRTKLTQIDHTVVLPNVESTYFETPEFNLAFQSIDMKTFDKVLATFRGTKAFFVKNEKEKMKEDLYRVLTPYAEEYLEDIKSTMLVRYLDQFNNTINRLKTEVHKHIDIHRDDYLKLMSTPIDINELKDKHDKIQAIIDHYN